MRIWRVTNKNDRRTLFVSREGFHIRYERPKVGGGWYSRELVTVPWKKEKSC